MQRLILEYYTAPPYGGCITKPILYSSKEELLEFISQQVHQYIENVFLKNQEFTRWRNSGCSSVKPVRLTDTLIINGTEIAMDDLVYNKEYVTPSVYTIDEYFMEVESTWFENNL